MKKIFILEDEALIAAEIESTLELLGYEVIGKARNGDKAIDFFTRLKPDLALLDINIKGSKNGIEVAHIIKEKYSFPYVFLTSFSDSLTLEKVKPTMPYGYIIKPFTDQDLKTNIELALFKFEQENKNIFPTLQELNGQYLQNIAPREYELFQWMYEGLTYQEIADKMFLSINTIKSYQKKLFLKLGVKSRSEAVRNVIDIK